MKYIIFILLFPIEMKRFITIFLLIILIPLLSQAQHTYIWPATSNSIVINRTNYPTLQAGDSVIIPPNSGGGGYRSRVITNLNAGAVPNPKNPRSYITVYWQHGAYITPQGSSIQANAADSLYGVHEVGLTMNQNPDPIDFSYSSTGYLQYYWQDSITCIACGGMFGSGPHTLSLTAYAGGADTAHMFWMDSISNSKFDSIGVRAFPGMNTLWLGYQTTSKNQIWGRFGIANTYFGHNPSTTIPASFIHMQCVFNFTITNCTFELLGSLGNPDTVFAGHAANIYLVDGWGEVKNCHFKRGFGNCWRIQGSGGIASFPLLNGIGSIHNCIDSFPIKYPFCEPQTAAASDSQYCPGFIPRAMPVVYNITFAHPAMGVGHQFYNCSTVDNYSGPSGHDTIRVYNCLQYGPTDTVATACNSQGCNAFLTMPNGTVPQIDTSGNIWSQTLTFTGTGLNDSVLFIPKINGLLYNHGVSNAFVRSGVDNNGVVFPVVGRPSFGLNTGIDIGANMLPLSSGCGCIGPIPVGVKANVTH